MATKKNPTNLEYLVIKAKKFIQSNELDLASKLLKENQINFPNKSPLLNLLKKSLQINQNQPLVAYDLGVALSLNNQLDEAIIFFNNSIALEPNNPKAYLTKAVNLKKLDRLNDSIDCYQKIIELSPNYIEAYVNKADLLELIGKLTEAQSLYQQAIIIEPKNADLYIKYGNFLDKIALSISFID